ncbi:hypothetical protein CEE45_13140 [Candidatus Heimdallarchaeota archaeon B3_Heim]|nr:MAG: hypothetical protein CEE45_13140 [Candidatus Heimdallarchaeota archaeon B3_Heim]
MIIRDIRQKFRLRMLALLVGVYNLNNEAKKMLIHEEKLVSATEIIYFSESLYLAAFIILVVIISVILLGIFNSTLFIPFIMITTLLALLFIGVVYSATRVEMIFLSSERVVIKYLSILEKILRVKRELSLSIDQISIISYGRAPFNRGALGLALLGTLTVSLMMFILTNVLIDSFLAQMTVIIISILVILIVLRLILFGLRLTRGVLELQTVGLTTPVQIGLDKGVPRSFIQEVHLAVLERVHHTLHHEDQEDIDIIEFPLESSKTLKNAFNQVKTSNEKKILKLLDQKPAQAEELCRNIPELSHEEIDAVLSILQEKNLISYVVDEDVWKLSDISTVQNK